MAVCSFLGHRDIYDADIVDRLQAAAEQIINENDTVEFLLYQCGDFSNQCILAALRVRNIFSEKVRITLVLPEDYFAHPGRNLVYGKENIPLCMADRIVMPHIEPPKHKTGSYIRYSRTMQWMLQRSTHLIKYLYEHLYEAENRLADVPGLEVIDIASEKTVQAIAETVVTIPERARSVYLRVKAGDNFENIAEPLRVSPNRVRQILDSGCKKLRRHLNWRYLKVQFAEKGGRNQSCSIFSVGEMNQDVLTNLERTVNFLITVYNVKNFYIEAQYSRSILIKIIKYYSNLHQELRIIAVTDGKLHQENDVELEDISASCCPPCHAAVCVGRADCNGAKAMGIIPDMIDLANFCLCNLSAVPDIVTLQKCISQTKHTVLMDIGRICAKPEAREKLVPDRRETVFRQGDSMP